MAAAAQTNAEDPVQSTFDVASVRPTALIGPDSAYSSAYAAGVLMAESRTPCLHGKLELSGARVRLTEVSICDLIRIAYEVKSFQVVGAPQAPSMTLADALDPNHKPLPIFFFDIEAEAPGQQPLNDALARTMLRSSLRDRFGLVVHRETRDLPIYALVADKRGLRPETKASPGCKPGSVGDFSQLCNQTMDKVVRNLSGSLDHPVVDMTGITEVFQYRIPIHQTDPDREANTRAAILDQLGLKLESRKGPMEVIVVDHVSPPSPN